MRPHTRRSLFYIISFLVSLSSVRLWAIIDRDGSTAWRQVYENFVRTDVELMNVYRTPSHMRAHILELLSYAEMDYQPDYMSSLMCPATEYRWSQLIQRLTTLRTAAGRNESSPAHHRIEGRTISSVVASIQDTFARGPDGREFARTNNTTNPPEDPEDDNTIYEIVENLDDDEILEPPLEELEYFQSARVEFEDETVRQNIARIARENEDAHDVEARPRADLIPRRHEERRNQGPINPVGVSIGTHAQVRFEGGTLNVAQQIGNGNRVVEREQQREPLANGVVWLPSIFGWIATIGGLLNGFLPRRQEDEKRDR